MSAEYIYEPAVKTEELFTAVLDAFINICMRSNYFPQSQKCVVSLPRYLSKNAQLVAGSVIVADNAGGQPSYAYANVDAALKSGDE